MINIRNLKCGIAVDVQQQALGRIGTEEQGIIHATLDIRCTEKYM